MKFYEVVEKSKKLDLLFLENIDEETGEILNSELIEEAEKELKNELMESSEDIIKTYKNKKILLLGLKTAMNELKEKQKLLEAQIERFENSVFKGLKELNIREVSTSLGKIKIKTSKIVEGDINKVPEKFLRVKTTKELDKLAIKAEIKAGREVEGAYITETEKVSIG